MKEDGEEAAGADGWREGGRPHLACGRGHRHTSAAQVAECDYRLAMRERRKLDEGATRGGEAARGGDGGQKR